MKRYSILLLLFSIIPSAYAVPVVPNFTQGSMTSNTETTSTVTETINSMNYDTGYQYVITGTNQFIVNSLTNWPVATVPAPPAVTVITPALVIVPANDPATPAVVEV